MFFFIYLTVYVFILFGTLLCIISFATVLFIHLLIYKPMNLNTSVNMAILANLL
jgi:hypothetical protein